MIRLKPSESILFVSQPTLEGALLLGDDNGLHLINRKYKSHSRYSKQWMDTTDMGRAQETNNFCYTIQLLMSFNYSVYISLLLDLIS